VLVRHVVSNHTPAQILDLLSNAQAMLDRGLSRVENLAAKSIIDVHRAPS
jgi:hypothetical protein